MNSKFKILFIYPNEPFLNPPPVGIGVLVAILKNAGFEVDIFDSTFYKTEANTSDETKVENLQVKPFSFEKRGIFSEKGDMFDDLRKKVENFKPNLIALSALEGTYQMGIKMLEAIKDYRIPAVAGGVFPTVSPGEVLAHPQISSVCIGEGEIALLELCHRLAKGKDYTQVRNLWIKTRNAKIIKNKLNQLVDLDEIPVADYSVFDWRRLYRPMGGKVYRTIPMETNRGCPFQCAFCNSPAIARLYKDNNIRNYFRKKSIKKIYEELKFLIKKWDAEYVYFSSDTFLSMSDKEFDEFVQMYSEFKLPFWIQTRVETVSFAKMKKLKKLGCHRMSLGLEHGNEEFRHKILKKRFTNKDFLEATKIINKTDIPLTINNIIGFPFETRKLVFDTIEVNRRITFDSCNAYAFYPFKGTQLYKLCKRKGFISKDLPLPACVTLGSILDMPQLSHEEIMGLMRTFILFVKMPKRYWSDIKRAEKFDDIGNKKFAMLKDICLKKYF